MIALKDYVIGYQNDIVHAARQRDSLQPRLLHFFLVFIMSSSESLKPEIYESDNSEDYECYIWSVGENLI